MESILYILAFGVLLGVLHLIFRKKEEESLEEFEKDEKEFEEKKTHMADETPKEESIKNNADKD